MLLVEQTFPEKYELLTNLIYDSTSRGYKNRRLQRVQYVHLNSENVVEIVNEIKSLDKKHKFLLKEEKRLLDFVAKIFKNKKEISFEDFSTLLKYSFEAVLTRLASIKSKLYYQIKANKLNVSQEDREYFFALENILQQIELINEDLESNNWDKRIDKVQVINKVLIVFKNLNELALCIALQDHESIQSISNTILSFDQIKFNVSEKIAA
jgi:hypothetical protein